MWLGELLESRFLRPLFCSFLQDARDQTRAIIACAHKPLHPLLQDIRADRARLEEWRSDTLREEVEEEALGASIRSTYRTPSDDGGSD